MYDTNRTTRATRATRTYRPEPARACHLPKRTPEQLAASGKTAVANRRHRAQIMDDIAEGRRTVREVQDEARADENRHLGKIRTPGILSRIPGVGRATVPRLCDDLGISPDRQIRNMGVHQVGRLDDTISALLALPASQRATYSPEVEQ
jgi:hypothetical protein